MNRGNGQNDDDWTPERRESFRRKRRGKNLVMLALLLGFVVLVYLIALVRMQEF